MRGRLDQIKFFRVIKWAKLLFRELWTKWTGDMNKMNFFLKKIEEQAKRGTPIAPSHNESSTGTFHPPRIFPGLQPPTKNRAWRHTQRFSPPDGDADGGGGGCGVGAGPIAFHLFFLLVFPLQGKGSVPHRGSSCGGAFLRGSVRLMGSWIGGAQVGVASTAVSASSAPRLVATSASLGRRRRRRQGGSLCLPVLFLFLFLDFGGFYIGI